MKYITLVGIMLLLLYTYSYAAYCWKKKNRLPAIGAFLLIIFSIVMPAIMLFTR